MGCIFGSPSRSDSLKSDDFSIFSVHPSDLTIYNRIDDTPIEKELTDTSSVHITNTNNNIHYSTTSCTESLISRKSDKCESREQSNPPGSGVGGLLDANYGVNNNSTTSVPSTSTQSSVGSSWFVDSSQYSPSSYAEFLIQSDRALSQRLQSRLIAQPHHSQTSYIKLKNKNMRFSSCVYSGFSSKCRKKCQDRVVFKDFWIGKSLSFKKHQYWLFAVFDGHGESGESVSQFLVQNLPKCLEKCLRKLQDEISAFQRCFQVLQHKLEKTTNFSCEFSGSTATCILLSDTGSVYIASIGDSRAVIAQENNNGDKKICASDLTYDHVFDKNKAELDRVVKVGGVVRQTKKNGRFTGPLRVWLSNIETPGLAVSRSFGDKIGTLCGICSDPEISTRKLIQEDRFIIIASDGVWDNLKSQEAADFITESKESDEACKKLVLEAARRSITSSGKYGEGVCDDIAAIIVYFDP